MKFRNKKTGEEQDLIEWSTYKDTIENLLSTHPDWEKVKRESESEITIFTLNDDDGTYGSPRLQIDIIKRYSEHKTLTGITIKITQEKTNRY
jgi:hypothetical protein